MILYVFVKGNNSPTIDGYTWIGNNRKNVSANSRCGAGGVGMFIKDVLYARYDFSVLNDEVDDILWVKVTTKADGDNLLECVCYIPPIGSSRVIDASEYFDMLLAQVSEYQNIGRMVIGGNFNSRCSDVSDYIEGVDDVCERKCIDQYENSYCNFFMEFLISTNFCMLNGRLGINDFTSISEKGKAVVDYICVPHSQFSDHLDFNVVKVSDIASNFSLPLPDKLSQMPDHSFICTDIAVGEYITAPEAEIPQTVKYNIRAVPDEFMDIKRDNIQKAIKRIQNEITLQKNVNVAYEDFVSVVNNEMKIHLPQSKFRKPTSNNRNKKLQQKPWWNTELSEMWEGVCEKERAWIKYKGSGSKQRLKRDFVTARRAFSYAHRKMKREYQKKIQDELSEACDDNQLEFWKKVKSIGISSNRARSIPQAVKNEDGVTVTEKEHVKEQWFKHFKDLHNTKANVYDNQHHAWVKEQLVNSEANGETSDNIDNLLNCDISISEVRKSVFSAKMHKACGSDKLYAEVLRNDAVIEIFHTLFNHCFKYGVVPERWREGIISPIHKANDIYCTSNYRGITLQNVSCKIYSDILNKRLLTWLEKKGKINDEQNGFRPKRSCEDHIYLLNSIISNSMAQNRQVFSCFVDFRQAFDRIDRDCLWYKLLSSGIRGRMYIAIKSLYENIRCCIKLNNGYGVTNTFPVTIGVKQGCKMSTSLFNIYINDLCTEINKLQCGIKIGEDRIALLMYADDLVLVADSALRLQQMLDCLLFGARNGVWI